MSTLTQQLQPYRAVISARFRMLLQYRAAAVGGLWTQIFFGLVLIGIYEAFFRSSSQPPPMTVDQIVSYVWLGQALFAMLPWNGDPDVRAMVRSVGASPMPRPWKWSSGCSPARCSRTSSA